jgi:multidrug efflux pump subunit AcrA (membrane-fusion protein)
VEAQKAAVNTAELHNAYGLSSGARAQARLSQENQLQANLTALRAQQQELDADVERQRSLLSQQYQSAIREAQAENDLAKAEALYEEARRKQDALAAQQQAQSKYAYEAAQLMADAGDYTQLVNFYKNQGVELTDDELRTLMGDTAPGDTEADDNTENHKPEDNGYVQVDTNATRLFKANVMTRRELSRTGGKFSSYEDYLETTMDQWLAEGRLTEDEVVTLMYYYGLI